MKIIFLGGDKLMKFLPYNCFLEPILHGVYQRPGQVSELVFLFFHSKTCKWVVNECGFSVMTLLENAVFRILILIHTVS